MFASGSIESISRLHLDTASINGFVSDAIWMETARATTPALTDYCPHIFHAFHPLQTLVQTPGSTHNSHFQIFQCGRLMSGRLGGAATRAWVGSADVTWDTKVPFARGVSTCLKQALVTTVPACDRAERERALCVRRVRGWLMIALQQQLLLLVVVAAVGGGSGSGGWGGGGRKWRIGWANRKRGRCGVKKGTRSSHLPSCMGLCTASARRAAAVPWFCLPSVAFRSDWDGLSLSVTRSC